MLKNFVLETVNAPGTSATLNLAGASAGRQSFAQAFASGVNVFYFLDDGTQAEWGIGLFTAGSPNTIARNTVIGNTAGTTGRLNFSGSTRVYNEVPAERLPYVDSTNTLNLGGAALNTAGGAVSTGGGAVSTGGGAVATAGGAVTTAGGAVTTGGGQVDIGAGPLQSNGHPLLRTLLQGGAISNNGTTKINIAPASAVDEISGAGCIVSGSAITIDTGTVGANGLDSGTRAASTWYHVFLIGRTDGLVAGIGSTSLTPTLPSGYTLRRRLTSVKTDSSGNILAFVQTGREIAWAVAPEDVAGTGIGSTAANQQLPSLPPGVAVRAVLSVGGTAGYAWTITAMPPGVTSGGITVSGTAGVGNWGTTRVLSDTAQHVAFVSNTAGTPLYVYTRGWEEL